jgi:hypothetical protein
MSSMGAGSFGSRLASVRSSATLLLAVWSQLGQNSRAEFVGAMMSSRVLNTNEAGGSDRRRDTTSPG